MATQASRATWAASMEAKTSSFKNSRREVLWKRSTLPVVVGERGAVRRLRMPFSLHMRSKRTSPDPGLKRPVKTLPLSVRIWAARRGVAGRACGGPGHAR